MPPSVVLLIVVSEYFAASAFAPRPELLFILDDAGWNAAVCPAENRLTAFLLSEESSVPAQ
jgi:hypothetical protein